MDKRTDSRLHGASTAPVRTSGRLTAWMVNHQLVATESLARLLSTPASSMMTWLVIAIALTLPGALLMTVDNLTQLSGHFGSSGRITVFLQQDVTNQEVSSITAQIEKMQRVSEVQYVSPEQALEEFRTYSGIEDALNYLDDNPLPPVLLVEPPLGVSKQHLDDLIQQISGYRQVESVQADLAWVERLLSLLALGQRLVLVIGALLALAIVLVVGNTIRLAIAARSDEIRVVKLVGGTNAYVRRPFLYTGLWYGLVGGLVALLMLSVCWLALSGPVADIAALYGADFALRPLSFSPSFWLVMTGAGLGWAGALWSVQRNLRQIEP